MLRPLGEEAADVGLDRGGSQVVLVAVPAGWGRSWLVDQIAETVRNWIEPARVLVIDGHDALGRQPGEQAEWLVNLAQDADVLDGPARNYLGVDRPARVAGLALGVVGVFAGAMTAQVALLLGSVGVGAVAEAIDRSGAGPVGRAARLGSIVARVSVGLPVAVLIDGADQVDGPLLGAFIRALVERLTGHVLVVAACEPGTSGSRAGSRIRCLL